MNVEVDRVPEWTGRKHRGVSSASNFFFGPDIKIYGSLCVIVLCIAYD